MVKKAIVRNISSSYRKCVTSHPQGSEVDINKARDQHQIYKDTLKDLGLEIIEINADDTLPDCCFIEDTAIIHKKKALLTRIGTESRREEITETAKILKNYFQIEYVMEPGTIDGGDIIHFENKLISGLSQRSNLNGIKQAEKWLEVKIDFIKDPNIIHLKSYISKLNNNTVLCTKNYVKENVLKKYEKIIVPESESYAANVLEINGTILIPKGFEKTKTLLKKHKYEIIELDTSEFQKCEGALTCLSVLF